MSEMGHALQEEIVTDAMKVMEKIQALLDDFAKRHGLTEQPVDLSTCELCRLEERGRLHHLREYKG